MDNVRPLRPVTSRQGEADGRLAAEAERSRFHKDDDAFWFLHPDYRPFPEHDVDVGEYRFSYRPEYCDFFARRGLEGTSLVSASAELGVPFTVIKHWAKLIPQFAVALDLAHESAQKYWEALALGISDPKFNAGGYLKMMAIRFPEHWREIDTVATVTKQIDPYGFEKQVEDEEAIVSADVVFERLMKIKEAG